VREADNTHHLHVPNVMEIWESKPPGTLWATPGVLRYSFTFYCDRRQNSKTQGLHFFVGGRTHIVPKSCSVCAGLAGQSAVSQSSHLYPQAAS